MKKKYKVFLELPFVILILSLISITAFFIAIQNALLEEDVVIVLITIFMLIVFPISLLIWSVLTMWATIIINEEGIYKYLFGKLKRTIKWDEVIQISKKGNYKQWIFISKSNLENISLTKSRLRKDNIYLYTNKDFIKCLKQYTTEISKEI